MSRKDKEILKLKRFINTTHHTTTVVQPSVQPPAPTQPTTFVVQTAPEQPTAIVQPPHGQALHQGPNISPTDTLIQTGVEFHPDG
jgi:hypothetical protein